MADAAGSPTSGAHANSPPANATPSHLAGQVPRKTGRSRDGCLTCKYETSISDIGWHENTKKQTGAVKSSVMSSDRGVRIASGSIWSADGGPSRQWQAEGDSLVRPTRRDRQTRSLPPTILQPRLHSSHCKRSTKFLTTPVLCGIPEISGRELCRTLALMGRDWYAWPRVIHCLQRKTNSKTPRSNLLSRLRH
jgi:hypothetical protein